MGTPMIVDGRTFVPLGYIATAIGATPRWDGDANAAYIYVSVEAAAVPGIIVPPTPPAPAPAAWFATGLDSPGEFTHTFEGLAFIVEDGWTVENQEEGSFFILANDNNMAINLIGPTEINPDWNNPVDNLNTVFRMSLENIFGAQDVEITQLSVGERGHVIFRATYNVTLGGQRFIGNGYLLSDGENIVILNGVILELTPITFLGYQTFVNSIRFSTEDSGSAVATQATEPAQPEVPDEEPTPDEPTPEPPPPPPAATETASQRNAVRAAEGYIRIMAFSRSGLIEQLEFEGYSNADAIHAVDSIGANWNEQAARKAQSYLDIMPFSRSGLIDQLVFDGFTREQATHGVNAVGL